MLLYSDLAIVPSDCAAQVTFLRTRGIGFDLKTVICQHAVGLKWTQARIHDQRSVYTLDRAIKAGLFGRASKSRYYVRVIIGDDRFERWYPFYVGTASKFENRRINPRLIAILTDSDGDEVNGG